MELYVDDRNGPYNKEIKLKNANINDTINWFSKLDGHRHTLLTLIRQDGHCFMVGGGPKNYIVTLDKDNKNLTLKNENEFSTSTIQLCAGGQYADFSEEICVSREQANNAINLFFDNKEGDMHWI